LLRKDHFGEDNDGAIEAAVSGLTPKVRQNNHGKSLQTSKADVERVFAAPGKECGIPSLKVPRAGGLVYCARWVGFMGHAPNQGHRRVWARLCFRGVRTSKARALWLMCVAQLLAPSAPLPKPENPHGQRRRLFDPNLT